jgi:predicted fused transcriptional regulator/phosphomethylpyrimidine kinase
MKDNINTMKSAKIKSEVRRHRHQWRTVFSHGHWGHEAVCRLCGAMATFVIREAQ